jgi:GR25 family glycosyltransferase involved in LPS biosynthesis
MECLYINLDGAHVRRAALEANFAACKGPGWSLKRMRAVEVGDIARNLPPGRIRDVEKAVYLSHTRAVETTLPATGHALIVEDDALFGPESCERIDSACAAFPEDAWDMLFTDITFVEAHVMTRFFSIRRELAKSGEEMLIPLREFAFTGASSYVVNRRFRERWLELLRAQAPLDMPIDLYMRAQVQAGNVRAFVTFPFVTSLTAEGDLSQYQPGDAAVTDTVWNAFRRFCWLHRDIGAALAPVERLGEDFTDPEARAFATLLGAALSDKMVFK